MLHVWSHDVKRVRSHQLEVDLPRGVFVVVVVALDPPRSQTAALVARRTRRTLSGRWLTGIKDLVLEVPKALLVLPRALETYSCLINRFICAWRRSCSSCCPSTWSRTLIPSSRWIDVFLLKSTKSISSGDMLRRRMAAESAFPKRSLRNLSLRRFSTLIHERRPLAPAIKIANTQVSFQSQS